MKRLLFLLFFLPLIAVAQYPTVTSQLSYARTQSSHGLSVGDWLTVDDSGVIVKGSDPGTQPFIGVVSKVVSSNAYEYAPPGGPITLSGLTAGEIYYAQDDGTLEPASTATDTNKPVLKAISTTQAILYSGAFGAADLPPPSTQVQNMSFAATGATTASGEIFGGSVSSGDIIVGTIILISDDPILWTPVNNVSYSSAVNLNFGSGDDVSNGDDVYVLSYGSGTTVDITGLTADETYFVTAYKYASEGSLISYNTSTQGVFNTASFNTFADAATPATNWQTLSKKPFKTSIQLTGVPGGGDQEIVLASTEGIPDTAPVDGVDYSVSQEVGNAVVAYKGRNSTFSIPGVSRDQKIYWKVYSMENTGFLYYPQATVDSAFAAYVRDTTFVEGSGEPPGKTLLEENGYLYLRIGDELTIANGANITNGDPGLEDQTANNHDAVIVGTPTSSDQTVNSESVKSVATTSTSGLSVGYDGDNFATNSSGFEIHWSGRWSDGISGSGGTYLNFYGNVGGGSAIHGRLFNSGQLQFRVRTPTGGNYSDWDASGFVADGAANVVLQIRYDYVNDIITVWMNGSTVSGSMGGSVAMSAQDPTSYNNDQNLYVGALNNGGSLAGNNTGATLHTYKFAVTGLLTTQQREDIYEYFSYTATAGTAFSEWDIVGTIDTYETVNDSLHLAGNNGGFGNRVVHIDVMPDSLQTYQQGMTLKITGALTTNASGIGIGVMNGTGEPNRNVMAQINLDTDAGFSFQKIQLFAGDGIVGIDEVLYRGVSSEGLALAEDSTLTIIHEQLREGNDAVHIIYATNNYDTISFTWTEVNAPSIQYYGTTMKPFIWFQGPDFTIGDYWVVRTGSATFDTSPPPAPTTGDAYVVASGGNDANDCTEEEPCATGPRGIERIVELSGSNRVLVLSSGNHTLPSALILPTNLIRIEGAGMDQTFIYGASGMNSTFDYNASGKALIRAASGSRVTLPQVIKGMTLIGGDLTVRNKAWGIHIAHRDGVTIENVGVHYFNSGGINIENSNDVVLTNIRLIDAAGANGGSNPQNPSTGWPSTRTWSGDAPYNLFGYQLGGITARGAVDNWEWNGGSVTATFGGGYGFKCLGLGDPGIAQMTNHEVHNVTFNMTPFSAGSTATNFGMEYHGSMGQSGSVFGTYNFHHNIINNGGALSLVAASSGISGSHDHNIYNNQFLISDGFAVEAQANRIKFYNNFCQSLDNMNTLAFSNGVVVLDGFHYHHNILEFNRSSATVGILMPRGGTITNAIFENNTINFTQGTVGSRVHIVYSTYSGSNQSSIIIRDNAILGDNPGPNDLVYTPNKANYFISSSSINNYSTDMNMNGPSGFTNSGNQNNQNASNWFSYTGPRNLFGLGGYYFPIGLQDLGNGGDDVGAVQHE